jgi:hypothetical protein
MASRGQRVWQGFAGGGANEHAVPIILDSGDQAQVAAFHPPGDLFVGLRFEYHGTVWEITHAKDCLRGWVAHPAYLRRR